jgi:two-component system sensor histidine kinase RegB
VSSASPTIGLAWVLRLRTASVLGVLALVLVAHFVVGIALPLGVLLAVLLAWFLTNVAASTWARHGGRVPESAMAGLLAADAVFLAAVFYWTGGPSNPFSFFFLVHLSLAAVALPARYAWAVAALSAVLFGLLFVDHVPLPHADAHGHHDVNMHLRGMWLAFVLAAAYILTFTTRLGRAIADQAAEVADARAKAARAEKLASLATLSAGAAHELATPLSTIAVIAGELERELATTGASDEVRDDVRVVREQVARCRAILDAMRARAGEPGGEAPSSVGAADLAARAVHALPDPSRVTVVLDPGLEAGTWRGFVGSAAQALGALVKNAVEASPPGAGVTLRLAAAEGGLRAEVLDVGTGFAPEIADRIGEPFFTTKEAGRGMGLGVFLARAVAERHGGRLDLRSLPGVGTTATLVLPAIEASA